MKQPANLGAEKPQRLISELHFFSIIGYQTISAHHNYSGIRSNEADIFLNISECCDRGK